MCKGTPKDMQPMCIILWCLHELTNSWQFVLCYIGCNVHILTMPAMPKCQVAQVVQHSHLPSQVCLCIEQSLHIGHGCCACIAPYCNISSNFPKRIFDYMFCRLRIYYLTILSYQSMNAGAHNSGADLWPSCAGNADMYTSGLEADAHSQDLSPPTPGHSMAQITPGGLRLYDAEGSCSMVPLEELKQIMSKLSFSRYTDLVLG